MTIESLVRDFGYLAVFIGTFLEGETILVVAGFAAYEAYLRLEWVIVAAFFGSLFGDQLYFFIGRYKGESLLKKYRSWEPRVNRFRKMMARHETWFILVFRFLYGLRTVAPFAIGLSDVPTVRFFTLNTISAALWSAAIAGLGYGFGRTMEVLIDEVKRYELAVMACLLVLAVILYVIKWFRNRDSNPEG